MLPLAEAQRRVLAALTPLPPETARLQEASGRILRERVQAALDLPQFNNSAVDGYAVRSADLGRASPKQPVTLRRVGSFAAGEVFAGQVAPGTCARLFTGAQLPPGADAVVMQEDAPIDPGWPEGISFCAPVRPGENVRWRGEDVREGDLLLAPGERLTAGRIALLGAIGRQSVQVGRPPRVALLATGSELREAGEPLAPGQIYESNRAALAALASQAGAQPLLLPLVKDEPGPTRSALTQAFACADLVVTSGGVSVGEPDLVKSAFAEIGGQLAFWKVAIRPGKPFVFGQWQQKPLFGLPGCPASAFVTFLLLVRPALARLQGAADCMLPTRPGVLAELLNNPGDRAHFLRVRCDAGQVRLAGAQGSHVLSSLAGANGLVEVPPQTSIPIGTAVSVITWD
jgi:molybdopterin molybdotransferase